MESLVRRLSIGCDELEVQLEVASIASTNNVRESKRARIGTASSAPAVNVDQLKFDSRAWEALLRDSWAPRLKTLENFPWETGYMAQVFNKSFQPCWSKPTLLHQLMGYHIFQ